MTSPLASTVILSSESWPEKLTCETQRREPCTADAAAAVFALSIVSMHVLEPAQSPDQPTNAEPEGGVTVSVTAVPAANCAVQVPPQSMPAGLEVTVLPPVTVTVNECCVPSSSPIGGTTSP